MDPEAKLNDYRQAARIHRGLGILYVIFALVFGYLIESGIWAVIGIFGTLATVHFLAYRGLTSNRLWGKILSGLLATLLLFGFPIGTILGGSILFYMFRIPRETLSPKLQPVADASAE